MSMKTKDIKTRNRYKIALFSAETRFPARFPGPNPSTAELRP